MADIVLNVHCGCGFKTNSLEAASKHSDTTHHKMDINGMVVPSRETEAEQAKVSASEIDAIRAKLGK